jgi:methionyl-tRNA formyltransferase
LSISTQAEPGTVIAAAADGLQVAAGEGAVLIESVQLEGGRPLAVTDFLKGHHFQVEDKLGE